MKDSTTRGNSYIKLCAIIFWLLVWEAVYRLVGQEVLVVSPVRTVRRLMELGAQAAFWASVSGTFSRVAAGFILSLLTGGALAVVTHRFRLMRYLFQPLLETIRATPVASLIILALVWLATNRIPVFIVFLMVTPIVWTNLFEGLRHVDARLLEMAKVFRFSRWKKIRLIYVPALTPYFAAACTTGMGAAWKSAIAAEVIAHPRIAMGTQIHNARIYLETADLFAWTVAVVILSVILEKLTVRLLAALVRRLLGEREGGGVVVSQN